MPPPQYPRLARGLLVLCVILTHHVFAQTECPAGGGDPIVLQVDSAHGEGDSAGSAVGTNCPDVGASHIESETDCVEAFLALCQGPLADDLFQYGFQYACYMSGNTGCVDGYDPADVGTLDACFEECDETCQSTYPPGCTWMDTGFQTKKLVYNPILGGATGGGLATDPDEDFKPICSCTSAVPDGLHTFSTGAVSPIVTEISTNNLGSIGTFTTFQLSLSLSATEANVYSLYATPDTSPMTFPAAFQTILGGDVGVTPIIGPFDAYDSYLTIGNGDELQAVGIDFSSWASDDVVVTDGGLVFMNPPNAPSGVVLISQLTVQCDATFVANVNAQGTTAEESVNGDWQQENILFSFVSGPCAETVTTSAVLGVSSIMETTEVGTVVQLSLVLSAAEQNVYEIYATPETAPITFPAALDGNLVIGNGDILVTNPVDTSSWDTGGLLVTNASVMLEDVNAATPDNVVIAQFTLPWNSCGNFSSSVNARGHSFGSDLWQQEEIEFAWSLPCFRAATDVSAFITVMPTSNFPEANSSVTADIYVEFSGSETSLATVSVTTEYHGTTVVVADGFAGQAVLVATVTVPTDSYEHGALVEFVIDAEGESSYEISGSGLGWQTQLYINLTVPQAAGCPYDSRDWEITGAELGWDGYIVLQDLLALLANYRTCFDQGSQSQTYASCNSEHWVGYPHDGYPQNNDGTYGDQIVNVHDLLDALGNFHRDYKMFPCV